MLFAFHRSIRHPQYLSLAIYQSFGRAWIFLIAAIIFLYSSGCSGSFQRDLEPHISSSNLLPSASKSLESTIYKAPYPGDYKLLTVKDKHGQVEQLWQARGELGQFGGALTVSSFGTGPKTFNCWSASDAESSGLASLMYEGLIDIDPWTAKFYPRLAKSFTISPDKCDYTFTLRQGLKWSDGEPITADDVVFTFGTLIAKGFGNASARDVLTVYGEFPSVKKIDDLTVKFHTKVPFAPFLSSLGMAIAPKHILEPLTKRPMTEFNGFWDINCDPKTLVVSGPFKLDRYIPGQRVELVANPQYSMVDKLDRRLPYLEKFVVLIVPDQSTQLLKFWGHEIDLLDVHSVRGCDAAQVKQKEHIDDFKVYNLGPDDGTMFLMFNLCRRKNPKNEKYYVNLVQQSWFNNDYFRQAVSHAIDRQCMIDNVLKGVGYELFTAEPSASIYCNKKLASYPQDLNLAAKLLSLGGFKKINDKLFDSGNHLVEFTLYTNAGNTTRDAICVMLQNDLQKLGMKVNYQPIDFNILIDKTGNSLDWEAVVMGLTGSRLEPYNGANVWKSDGRLHMFDQRLPAANGAISVNDARPWEREIDQCFDRGATTLDTPLRHKYFDRYQEIAYEKQPFIYLYANLDLSAVSNRIGNYMPTPLAIGYGARGTLHNIEEIYFKRKAK